jgi:hypothetical protein
MTSMKAVLVSPAAGHFFRWCLQRQLVFLAEVVQMVKGGAVSQSAVGMYVKYVYCRNVMSLSFALFAETTW